MAGVKQKELHFQKISDVRAKYCVARWHACAVFCTRIFFGRDCRWAGRRWAGRRKKPEPFSAPAVQLVCARINFVEPDGQAPAAPKDSQALRRGLTVRSRTWARMLDI